MDKRPKSKTLIVAAVILLVLSGLALYYVVALRNSDTQPAAARPNQSGTSRTAGQNLPEDAKRIVASAYDAYLADREAGEGGTASRQALAAFEASVTDELAARLTPGGARDPVLCSRQLPERLVYGEPVILGDMATLAVTDGEAAPASKATVTVAIGTGKITDISCN